ncbi:centrosomal protein of 170 kDa protein B isoform X2 [Pangasianodon hypophthalmus]|uniref:centrosomal protein of 170 kDa protein B isoform X2 n=1 Tax=Pangasianodon hypophthalmus TaxID=310915 RepID=UPI0023073344|nr:centrosomal protein of 170 kDa protein B isoform X2 [Pangasianodon hypophthalmus]
MSVTSWFLVSSSGTRHRLPREMIFVGREDCELMLQSRSVDKQHAVINYNAATDEHLVKDLGSLNGTFVNDLRIPDQTYITLKLSDVVRFGYDSHVYVLERSQHRVPEEALKHEKYTSQLQMELKSSELKKKELQDDRTKTDRSERKSLTEASMCRPTPLYGQPSWWGEEDSGRKDFINEGRKTEESRSVLKEAEVNGSLQEFRDGQSKPTFLYHREPSYFEIPTKEIQTHSKFAEMELNDIPTKDTDALPKSTPPVYQSHASFTIEFDECTPGKIKIKDHVTKFSSRQRSKQPSAKVTSAAPTEVQSPESKVADWLVQSDVGMMSSRRPTSDDVYSTKSDLAMHIRTLKGHHHEDGTQSDSEDPVIKGKRSKSHHSVQSEESNVSKILEPSDSYKPQSPPKNIHDFSSVREGTGVEEPSPSTQSQMKCGNQEPLSQQAFIIEFFDDNPRKKRSQSFTHNPVHGDNYSALKAKLERRKGAERPASVHGNIPPTQQITVPLKGLSHGVHQRSSSLKREKTEDMMSKGGTSPSSSGTSCSITSSSSRSSPAITIKPFGSIGKKSKLAQEFVNEFLNEPSPPMSAPPVMMSPSHTHLPSPEDTRVCAPSSVSYPASPSQIHTHHLPQTLLPASSPISVPSVPPSVGPDSSISTLPPFSPLLGTEADSKALRTHPKGTGAIRTEEEDSLSDAGTYTIETESQDKEVEEARSMIDQVFGVLDAPEYSGVYRPVISEQDVLNQTQAEIMHTSAEDLKDLNSSISGDPESFLQAHSDLSGPKWVSQWASLADTYSDSGTAVAPLGSPPQGTVSHRDVKAVLSQSVDHSESECTQSSKTRRLLPQVPSAGEKQEINTPCILIRTEPSVEYDPSEKVSRTSQPDSTQRLKVQEDVDHDSLSDTSRSDDSSILDRSSKSQEQYRMTASLISENIQPKSTSFYIGSEEGSYKSDASRSPVLSQTERAPSPKMPPTTVLIRHLSSHESKRAVKPNSSAPNLQTHNKDSVPTKEPPSSSFVRQESFTKDRPSDNIQVKRLPHISSHPTLRDLGTLGSERETLSKENKQSTSSQRQKKGSSLGQAEDSLSGESDVDTASTVSLVSSKNVPVSTVKKHISSSAHRKDKSSSGSSSQEKSRQPTARERLSEKRRSHAITENSAAKSESARRLHLRRSTGNSGSLDFSDNQQIHSQTETASSDHESTSRPSSRKKLSVSLQNQDSNKSNKAAHQVLTRSNSLSAPRPTRASMLRRARLGETSDNEGTETDRASQGSEHTKPSGDTKKLSRLDILAMPRKRTGSFTTPSDNESLNKQTHSRPSDATTNGRRLSTSETKPTNKISPTAEKPLSNHTRTNQTKHAGTSSSHRRQKGSDYSSTSEEERDVSSKTKCSHTSTSTQTQTPQRIIPTRLDIEDDEAQNEHYQNWTNHSAEIARLSQDLAKDLAILAREIHDVAGDADTHTPAATGYSTPPGSVPHTPASTISAREELVHHIPDASLSYQKVPAGSPSPVDQDSDGTKRRPWNREEVILDNLMLNPVSQLSQAIRENTEQLTEKMKSLFHNTTDVWEEIEAKINAEDEVPIIKTSNKEISSILQELRRVQRQLEVINSIVEPGGSVKITAPPAAGKNKSANAKRSGK